jgi:hypothetical protein
VVLVVLVLLLVLLVLAMIVVMMLSYHRNIWACRDLIDDEIFVPRHRIDTRLNRRRGSAHPPHVLSDERRRLRHLRLFCQQPRPKTSQIKRHHPVSTIRQQRNSNQNLPRQAKVVERNHPIDSILKEIPSHGRDPYRSARPKRALGPCRPFDQTQFGLPHTLRS